MEYRGPGRGPLAVALALILILSLFGVATSHAATHSADVRDATGSTLAVTASTGYLFTPSLMGNVPLGTSIVVTFTDGDSEDHTFTIASRQGWVIPNTYTEGQLDSFLTQYPPLFNINGTAASQAISNFTSPATPGWYEFVCTEAGHFELGMYGFIASGVAPTVRLAGSGSPNAMNPYIPSSKCPANLTVGATPDGPGAAVFIIV